MLETTIPGTIGAALCATGIWHCIRLRRLAAASTNWPSAAGRVVESTSRVVRRSHSAKGVTVQIAYEYSVDGVSYRGRRVRFGFGANLRPEVAASIQQRYPVGATVRPHYDPRDPSQCTLEPVVTREVSWLLGVLVFVLAAILVALLPS